MMMHGTMNVKIKYLSSIINSIFNSVTICNGKQLERQGFLDTLNLKHNFAPLTKTETSRKSVTQHLNMTSDHSSVTYRKSGGY
jgi:hypothetical protein